MQAYLLADAEGRRLDGKANPDIVQDVEGGIDVQVINGRSCMGCHSKGMRDAPDVVRSSVLNAPSFPNRDKILAVYPERAEFNKLLEADVARFEKAIVATGGQITTADPVNELSKKYKKPLALDLAAAELGLTATEFKQKIREDQTLGNLGFGQFLEPGGAYQRDTWEENFPALAIELDLGNPAVHVLIRESSQPLQQSKAEANKTASDTQRREEAEAQAAQAATVRLEARAEQERQEKRAAEEKDAFDMCINSRIQKCMSSCLNVYRFKPSQCEQQLCALKDGPQKIDRATIYSTNKTDWTRACRE